MSTHHRRLLLVAAIAAVAACGDDAPPPPATVLGPPADTALTSYAEVTRAVWLGGDRWAVSAPRSEAVGVVDFGSGTVARLGGADSTPRNPTHVFTTPDTLYVSDWGLRGVTVWTTGGAPVRTVPTTDAVQGALPQARDGAGRFYVEIIPPPDAGGANYRDSAAVVRAGATLERADTVARLTPLDVAEVVGDAGRRFQRRVFSGADEWGVTADGSVWVARAYHNRVDWRSPDGAWTRGKSLPDRVLEVTRYDRELYVRNFPKEMRTAAHQLPFAPLKPPFEDAFDTPDGDVWLVKSRARTDSTGQYHVVGRGGRLRRDLRVPGPGRVVGASADAAIAAERTPKGVRLLRFVLPPIGKEADHAD